MTKILIQVFAVETKRDRELFVFPDRRDLISTDVTLANAAPSYRCLPYARLRYSKTVISIYSKKVSKTA